MDWVFSDCLALVAAVSSLLKSEPAVDRKPCNPAVRYGWGEAKAAAYHAAGRTVIQWILPWSTYTVSGISEREQAEISCRMWSLQTRFLCRETNIGCRGAGVKLL